MAGTQPTPWHGPEAGSPVPRPRTVSTPSAPHRFEPSAAPAAAQTGRPRCRRTPTAGRARAHRGRSRAPERAQVGSWSQRSRTRPCKPTSSSCAGWAASWPRSTAHSARPRMRGSRSRSERRHERAHEQVEQGFMPVDRPLDHRPDRAHRLRQVDRGGDAGRARRQPSSTPTPSARGDRSGRSRHSNAIRDALRRRRASTPTGALDRAALAARSSSPTPPRWRDLEAVVHPGVRAALVEDRLDRARSGRRRSVRGGGGHQARGGRPGRGVVTRSGSSSAGPDDPALDASPDRGMAADDADIERRLSTQGSGPGRAPQLLTPTRTGPTPSGERRITSARASRTRSRTYLRHRFAGLPIWGPLDRSVRERAPPRRSRPRRSRLRR